MEVPSGHIAEQILSELRALREEVIRQSTEIALLRETIPDKLYTKQEVAKLFSISPKTVERRVNAGLLDPVPGLARMRFTKAEVDRAKDEGIF